MSFFGGLFFGAGFFGGVTPTPAIATSKGGVMPVKSPKVKKNEREDVEAAVLAAFDKVLGVEERSEPEYIAEVKQQARKELRLVDLSSYDAAMRETQQLIARIQQHIQKLEEDEADDEDALLMLL